MILSDAFLPATILDMDSQRLASGEGRYDTERTFLAFWPQPPIERETLLAKAAIVETSEARHWIRRIQHVSSQFGDIHYECYLEPNG